MPSMAFINLYVVALNFTLKKLVDVSKFDTKNVFQKIKN